MPADVIMPNLGLTMEEGLVARWLVAPGERVERGQPLFEVETDKVSVEVEALATGVLGPVMVEAGHKVAVGTVLARIYESVEAREGTAKSGSAERDDPTAIRLASSGQRSAPSTSQTSPRPPEDLRSRPQAQQRLFSSPRARKIARERGIDWRRLSGSGPRGRVIERDVLAASAPAPGAPRPPATYLTAEVDLSRLLDAHRRLAPFLRELRLVDWLLRILAVALDEMQVTADLAVGIAGAPPQETASVSFMPHPYQLRFISGTALKSLARIAAERFDDTLVPPALSAAVFLVYDLSNSRIATFMPALQATEIGCLTLGPIGKSGSATISLACNGLLLSAPHALHLMERVIDLIGEPAGLLLAI